MGDRTIAQSAEPGQTPGPSLRVAILGGGASGALAAVHLLRAAGRRSLRIDLIDETGSFGLGAAYSTSHPLHLLNVPAVRMGAIADCPEHFHRWVTGRGDAVEEAAFLPRGLYGEYLVDLLAEAERMAPDAVLRRRGQEAISICEGAPGESAGAGSAPLEIELGNGERLKADAVILALGPPPGGDPVPVPDELRETGRYVADPWAEGALGAAHGDSSVLLIGTGLTMVDVAISLTDGDGGPRRLRAISRHGLLPRAHRRSLTRVELFALPAGEGLEAIFAAVATELERAAGVGREWRDVIDSARTATPAAWRRLDLADKRRFLVEVNRYWDVHRFRIAPDVAERVGALAAAGRISWGAAGIDAIESHGAGARVRLREAGGTAASVLEVDRVINCTGAGTDITAAASPLLRSLFEGGLARPDPLRLGLDVAPSGAALDARGRENQRLRIVGAMRKGVEWEAIGITEIRDHAASATAVLDPQGGSIGRLRIDGGPGRISDRRIQR